MVAAALTSVWSGGCRSRETAVERGTREGVLHVANTAEPADLDPQVITGRPEHRITMALMEGLMSYDPVTVQPVPGVAERWEISADRLTYTFHLRADARWSNGDPVTASDFVGSWQRMLTPAFGAEYAYMLFHVVGAQEFNAGTLADFAQVGFRALDAHTIEVRLKQPAPFFLNLLNHESWYPVHLPTVEKFGGLTRKGTEWTRPGNYVGNGPFVLKEWRPQQRIVVAKSPTYWDRDRVRLNGIVFYPTESEDTEEKMFRSGQLHLTDSLPLNKVDAYRKENPELLKIHPFFASMLIRVNTRRPQLADARLRRALGLAIDRETLCTDVLRGTRYPAYGLTPPGAPGFAEPRGFFGSLDEARQLLAAAGHANGDGLGRLEMLYPTSDNGKLIAEAVQEMWRVRLGIPVQLVNQEWRVYLDSMNNGAYDLALGAWVGDFPDPHTFLDMFVTDGGNNRTGWSNAAYDRLVVAALSAPDEPARMAIYGQLEQILAAEAPMLPVYFYATSYVIRPSVRGWNSTVLDVHPYKNVWLEAEPR